MNLHVQLVAGRTCKVRDKLCCTSCNVIYLINCKLCKEQYEDFAFKGKFKPRFRVHKRDVKLVKIDVVWCSLLSFASFNSNQIFLKFYGFSWNLSGETFWQKKNFQKTSPFIDDVIILEHWCREILAVRVSIFCMLLCCSCLMVGVMSCRILCY